MRTKTLLLAAAITVAGFVSSQAATVYSQNIVGYVNSPVGNTYTIKENPLDQASNTIQNVITPVPGLVILTLVGGSYAEYDFLGGGPGANWYSVNDDAFVDNTFLLSPGQSFWVKQPGAVTNLTFVGQVKTGTNTITITPGFGLYGSLVPISTNATAIGLTAALIPGDYVLKYTGTFKEYDYQGGGVWYSLDDDDLIEPTFAVGEGFFVRNISITNKIWTTVFVPTP